MLISKKEKNNLEKRLFVGIDIPEEIKKRLYDVSGYIGEDKEIKRVSLSNIHITLRFLGNVRSDRIEKIKKAIKSTAEEFDSFDYEIKGNIGAFPNVRNATVVFVEIGRGFYEIKRVYDFLERKLCEIKIEREKREFVPHITIARIKKRKNIEKEIQSLNLDSIDGVKCSKITLYESILRPQGPEYIIIDEFSLK